jgi:hypothetical protein
VQVATRFTVTKECGLPDKVKQEYFKASEDDIIVNGVSPTGYPMRMLKNTPAIGAGIRPGCESYGYLLDATATAPTSTPTTAKWRPIPNESRRGDGQDLPVHPHAQLQLLDLRPLHLPPQGHLVQEAGRRIPDPDGGTRVQGLPVQHRQQIALPEKEF